MPCLPASRNKKSWQKVQLFTLIYWIIHGNLLFISEFRVHCDLSVLFYCYFCGIFTSFYLVTHGHLEWAVAIYPPKSHLPYMKMYIWAPKCTDLWSDPGPTPYACRVASNNVCSLLVAIVAGLQRVESVGRRLPPDTNGASTQSLWSFLYESSRLS